MRINSDNSVLRQCLLSGGTSGSTHVVWLVWDLIDHNADNPPGRW